MLDKGDMKEWDKKRAENGLIRAGAPDTLLSRPFASGRTGPSGQGAAAYTPNPSPGFLYSFRGGLKTSKTVAAASPVLMP